MPGGVCNYDIIFQQETWRLDDKMIRNNNGPILDCSLQMSVSRIINDAKVEGKSESVAPRKTRHDQ